MPEARVYLPRTENMPLRWRLSLWQAAVLLLCLCLCALVLLRYLRYELRASREHTMVHREQRFLTYLGTEQRLHPDEDLEQQIAHFAQASPDTDEIGIFDGDGRQLYPRQPFRLPRPTARLECPNPCLTTFTRDSKERRLLTHRVTLAGRPVWLLMSGLTDEHQDILRHVVAGFLVLLPVALAGSLLGGYLLSRRALTPVGRLTAAARRLSLAALEERLPVPQTRDELQSLAEAWNDLLHRLETEVTRSTRFTMDVSHDLRSAMTVICTNAELALERPRSAAAYRESLHIVQTESNHVLKLLEDLLLATRMENAQQSMARYPIALGELVEEVYRSSCATADMRRQDFRLKRPDDGDRWVLGDRTLLRRMISSLVDNALMYTPEEGSIAITLTFKQDETALTVEDDGVGIAPELQHRVFDRLFRGDASRSRGKSMGTGLGLSIAKGVAQLHGFEIELTSAPGQGTHIVIHMPVHESAVSSFVSRACRDTTSATASSSSGRT